MPVEKGVGYNPHSTPNKQNGLDKLAGHLIGAVAAKAKKDEMEAIVLDMTCGPGYDGDGNIGSPLILAKHVHMLLSRNLPCRLVCIDREATHLGRLRTAMHKHYPGLQVGYGLSQSEALEVLPANTVGLAYFDPTRYTDLDTNLLSDIGRRFYYMDILFTRECLAGYRMLRARHTKDNTLSIQDYLAATGKKCRYVVQYAKYGWWSFGFADNWEDRPQNKLQWSGVKLVRDDTPQGQAIINHHMGKEEEPLCKQLVMFR